MLLLSACNRSPDLTVCRQRRLLDSSSRSAGRPYERTSDIVSSYRIAPRLTSVIFGVYQRKPIWTSPRGLWLAWISRVKQNKASWPILWLTKYFIHSDDLLTPFSGRSKFVSYNLYSCGKKRTSCRRTAATICLSHLQVDNIFVFIRQVAPIPACWLFKTSATSWPLTFWPWNWCPSHVRRGLPLCQF